MPSCTMMDISTRKQAVYDIVILALIAVIIGVYLIGTTVMISKDGVLYIERAHQLSDDYHSVMNQPEPFGFPVLIFGIHYLATLIFQHDSQRLWIFSAQSAVLICKTGAAVVLYLFGGIFGNRRYAFWGVLVLLVLPYPAQFGADVLRDWPHLFFLFAALLFLLRGIQKNDGYSFFLSGLICGLGHLIRPECAQVILYGLVFLIYKTAAAIRTKTSVWKHWKYLLLMAGFLAVFIPYAMECRRIFPYKLEDLYRQVIPAAASRTFEPVHFAADMASFSPEGLIKAAGTLINETIQNLMYYFALPAGIGFYLLFIKRCRRGDDRHLLAGLFAGFYAAALCLLEMRWGYISRRHVLPLTALFCFYVPCGLEQIALLIERKKPSELQHLKTWFVVLLVTGILICLPKLVRPLGHDKKEYRQAAAWIAEKTSERAWFYTFDSRIPFYANRSYTVYSNDRRLKSGFKPTWLIALLENGQTAIPVPEGMTLRKKFPMGTPDNAVLIYKRTP